MSIAFPRTKAQWPKMNKCDVESTGKEASERIETDLATGPIEGSEQYIEKTKAERTLLWKADLVILPLSAIAWWVTYLDRNSIGNARIMGLQKDLNMTADQFYNCLCMFFVGYIAFLLPANLTSRIFKPNRSIGGACCCFGAILCGMAESRNYATILSLRILLGSAQAYVQFIQVYMTLWYKREEVAFRTGIFFSCATISGSFGGLIAYSVEKTLTLDQTGRAPWSWLFIIEGCLAIIIGIMVIVFLPRLPDDLQTKGKGHWLFTEEEIILAKKRFAVYNTPHEKIKFKQLLEVLKDPKSHFLAVSQGACVIGVSVVGSFMPTFISSFGFGRVDTQLFTIIPYACAFCLVIVVAYLSDRLKKKMPFLLSFFVLGCLGYMLLISIQRRSVQIFASCLITSSCYVCLVLNPVWININTVGFTKRGASWAYAELYGLTFSIMGTKIYDTPPRYLKGHATVLSLNLLACCAIVAAYLYMRSINRKKDRILAGYTDRGEEHPHIANGTTLDEACETHISYRYAL